MIIKLSGKQLREGVSRKSGKPYSFIVLHFLLSERGVDGQSAQQKLVDPAVVRYESLLVGQSYNVDCDFSGNVISVTPAKS